MNVSKEINTLLTRHVNAVQCMFLKLSVLFLFMNECSLNVYAWAFLPLFLPANQCVYPPFRTTDESPELAEPWQAKSPVLMNTHLK